MTFVIRNFASGDLKRIVQFEFEEGKEVSETVKDSDEDFGNSEYDDFTANLTNLIDNSKTDKSRKDNQSSYEPLNEQNMEIRYSNL